ncbi:MAG: D-amino acid aminotransferase [Clostridiales bacterium]|mgnify:CR=1 FL=1|nr:D-amino acid aminotransferase [Clostridiales bacterium]
MKNLGYYNGRYGLLEFMSIPMLDRSIAFGDAVYESVYTRNYIPYSLDEHIDRFFASAAYFGINLSFTKNKLKDIILELVHKVDSPEQMVYWQASRGTQIRSHVYDKDLIANLLIMLTPKSIYPMDKQLKLMSSVDTRHYYCNIKTPNILANTLARTKAADDDFDEVVFVRNNYVTECAHSNISYLKDGVFITSPLDCNVLNGIARKHLLEKCSQIGIPFEERHFTLQELKVADTVINSSAGSLCNEVIQIDNDAIGGKGEELFKTLQQAIFDDYIKGTTIDE